MMQVINQLSKLNCFNGAVGKIIIKNFIAHNYLYAHLLSTYPTIYAEYAHHNENKQYFIH
jgi:hypothetical protein